MQLTSNSLQKKKSTSQSAQNNLDLSTLWTYTSYMIKTLKYEITNETIKSVVDFLNEYEFDGRNVLTVELVLNDKKLSKYIFRRDTISDILNGDILEVWNGDGFCDIFDYVNE